MLNDENSINIAMGFDKKFLPHAATAIKSIVDNNKNTCINFVIMTDNSINKIDRFLLKRTIGKKNSANFINMSTAFQSLFEGIWSTAMYYPLLLSSLCPYDKILFLDADLIVTGSLKQFYDTDLSDFYCAAIKDYSLSILCKKSNGENPINNNNDLMSMGDYMHNRLGFSNKDIENYFNSGVLLLNLNKIRNDKIENKMLDFLNNNDLMFPDQDVLNKFFKGKTKLMPYTNNWQVIFKDTIDLFDEEEMANYKSYINDNKKPLIIHFLDKPFRSVNKVLYSDKYFYYRNKTFWRFTIDENFRKKNIRFRLSKREKYLYILGHKIFDSND